VQSKGMFYEHSYRGFRIIRFCTIGFILQQWRCSVRL